MPESLSLEIRAGTGATHGVCSVLLADARNTLSREAVERHFNDELSNR